MSYLADIKSDLKGLFDEAFDHAWKEIVEPALKQSYKNGVADGRTGKGDPNDAGDAKPRRQWGQRRSPKRQSGESECNDASATYTVSAIRRRRQRKPAPRIEGPADIHRVLSPLLQNADREHFYVFLLSTKNHVLAVELVSVGSLSASLVHPREVFKPAIVASAAAIVVAHNHPSSDPTPSVEDIEFTRRLFKAGELIGIRVLDHVIVANGDFLSLKEAGHLGG